MGGYIGSDEIIRVVTEGVAEGVNDLADSVLDEALLDTPFDTSQLYNSGRLEERARREHLWASVMFGGDGWWGEVPYGAAQHEGEMWYVRDGQVIHWVVRNRPAGGKTKWLEHALLAHVPRAEGIIARAVKRRLRFGR